MPLSGGSAVVSDFGVAIGRRIDVGIGSNVIRGAGRAPVHSARARPLPIPTRPAPSLYVRSCRLELLTGHTPFNGDRCSSLRMRP
jgi:hypothetical protein